MTEYEQKILNALDGHGAMLTRDVAEKVRPVFGHSNRTHSMAVRSWLLGLEKQGLVSKLDNQKPVCWQRTGDAP